LTIGNSRVFELAKLISSSLNIPYLTIKSDTNTYLTINNDDNKYELNMHPPINKLINAIIDLMDHYKWTFITVLYQEPNRIEDLVRLNGYSKHRLIFKYLDRNSSTWNQLFKEIRQSGSFCFIIDLKTKLINEFIHLVNFFIFHINLFFVSFIFYYKADKSGLTSFYYHWIFMSLDASVIRSVKAFKKISCNISSLQLINQKNLKAIELLNFLNQNIKLTSKQKYDYLPVNK
jgi:hypothetical protein